MVHISYEYSDGRTGVKNFESMTEAYKWVYFEGDHLIEWTCSYVG